MTLTTSKTTELLILFAFLEKEKRKLSNKRRTQSDSYLAKIPPTLESIAAESKHRPGLIRRVSEISITSILSISSTQSLMTVDDYLKKKKKKDTIKLLTM